MAYNGDIPLSQIIYFKFTTVDPTTGGPKTLTGSPAISVYKDDGTTESTAGVTLTVDFDGRTGFNSVKIDTSADGTFYAAAHDFQVVITTGAVGSVSAVGFIVGEFSINNRSALRPATAGRTLVVDAAGLADANAVKVGPTGAGTAQTAGDIMADTNDIQARLPAALDANGYIKADVEAWKAGVVPATAVTGVPIIDLKYILGTVLTETAGQIAGAFKKFFDKAAPTGTINSIPDAVAGAASGLALVGSNMGTVTSAGSVTGAVGSVTGNVGGNVNGNVVGSVSSVGGSVGSVISPVSVGSVGTSAIDSASFAANAITAAAIATDAIDADAIAASAVTEIQAGLATAAALATVQSDTDDIQSRLPAALVGGKMDSHVNDIAAGAITAAAIATNAIDADALAADAVTEIASGVWKDATAGDFTVASSIGKSLYTGGVVPGAADGLVIAGVNDGIEFTNEVRLDADLIIVGNQEVANLTVGGIIEATTLHLSGDFDIDSNLAVAGGINVSNNFHVAGQIIADGGFDGNLTGNVGGNVQGDVEGKVLGGGGSSIVGVGVRAELEPTESDVVRTSTLQSLVSPTIVQLDAGASTVDDVYNGEPFYLYSGAANSQIRTIVDYDGTTKNATLDAALVGTVAGTETYIIIRQRAVAVSGSATPNVNVVQIEGADPTDTIRDAILTDATRFAGANVGTILSDTNDIQTRLPAALVGGRMDSSVGAVAANAITAASIATDAIDADALAADAITEIQAGLATAAAVAAVQADTDDIQSRLPAALVGGRIDASVGAVAANAITAAAIATDAIDADALAANAVTEIASGVWKDATVGDFSVASSIGRGLYTSGFLPGTTGGIAVTGGDVGSVTGNVNGNVIGSVGGVLADVGGKVLGGGLSVIAGVGALVSVNDIAADAITAASIATDAIDADAIAADAVTEIQAGLATAAALATVQADTNNIQTRLPAALVGGKMDSHVADVAADAIDATALAASAVAEIADGVWDELIAGHLGAGSTGAALNAAGSAGDPWATPLPGAYGAGTAGFIVGTNLDSTVSGVQSDTNDIQTRLPAALVGGRIDASVGAMAANVITATAIATDAIDADALAADAITEIQAGLATAAALATVQADTDNIQTRLPAALVGGRIDASVGAMAADVITAAALATSAVDEVVDGVWDEAIAGHLAAGSTGAALNAAGSAGDPWTTPIPGAYGAGTAGFIVGTNLDGKVGDVPTANENADALLDRAAAVDGYTPREIMRVEASALAGKVSGGPQNPVFRSINDAKDRITATADGFGDRTAIAIDAT